jgi:hypothetical protein
MFVSGIQMDEAQPTVEAIFAALAAPFPPEIVELKEAELLMIGKQIAATAKKAA